MLMHPVRVGTCGWSYKEWSGAFYTANMASGDWLPYLAQHYPVVEVDSTFYRSPSRKTVEGWRDRTPPGFAFSLKVPQSITHEKALLDCRDEVGAFLAAPRLLGDKLLCCTLQFCYFNKGKFTSLNAFLERLEPFLEAWPDDVPLAVEVRNKNWMTEALGGCLRRHNAVWVLPDQAWMPSPLSVVQRLDVVTGPFAYLRLLGGSRGRRYAATEAGSHRHRPPRPSSGRRRGDWPAAAARAGRRLREQPLRRRCPGDGTATRGGC
jgi:uncharacterized protein YecE (DUF72 family)